MMLEGVVHLELNPWHEASLLIFRLFLYHSLSKPSWLGPEVDLGPRRGNFELQP